jgi:transcription-repair coupling factor (superfamily II helicase)
LLIVPVRERFDEEPDSIPLFEFLFSARGLGVVVSEEQHVREQAQKVRDQLESSFGDAAARGHVAALPPTQAYVTWSGPRAAAAGRPPLEELAIDESASDADPRSRIPAEGTSAASLRSNFVDVSTTGSRRSVRPASAKTQSCLWRKAQDAPNEPSNSPGLRHRCGSGRARGRRIRGSVLVAVGSLSRGFRLADAALQVYAETDVFEEERHATEKRRNLAKAFLSDLRDLKVGDLVVHVDHGIGEFVGLKQLGVRGSAEGAHEFLELRYHGDDKLFVPVERLDLIQKYTGGTRPALDRLGGTTWEKAKTRVKKAMRDMPRNS